MNKWTQKFERMNYQQFSIALERLKKADLKYFMMVTQHLREVDADLQLDSPNWMFWNYFRFLKEQINIRKQRFYGFHDYGDDEKRKQAILRNTLICYLEES